MADHKGEPALNLFIFAGLFCGLCWVLWHNTQGFWLEHVIKWLRFVELGGISIFDSRYSPCMDWIRLAHFGKALPSSEAVAATNACFGSGFMATLPGDMAAQYYHISSTSLGRLGSAVMTFYRWPIMAVLVGIGGYEMFLSPRNKFLTKHNLETLISTQAKMWPAIMPIVKFNPSKSGRILGDAIPDKLPVFAEALSPEEWIAWNNIPVVNGIPDRDAARRAFIKQLGPRWNGIDSLPLYMRALLAAFALRGAQKRDDSDELLGKLALAWSPGKGFAPDAALTGEIANVLNDPKTGGRLSAVMDSYAWRTTAMLGALRWARANGGVLAPAHFLWVRAEDRMLWYPLNNLGRRAFHSEGAGAMAHFMAEESAKKPLPIPRIDTAIVTLNTYLHDPDKRPVPIPRREG